MSFFLLGRTRKLETLHVTRPPDARQFIKTLLCWGESFLPATKGWMKCLPALLFHPYPTTHTKTPNFSYTNIKYNFGFSMFSLPDIIFEDFFYVNRLICFIYSSHESLKNNIFFLCVPFLSNVNKHSIRFIHVINNE